MGLVICFIAIAIITLPTQLASVTPAVVKVTSVADSSTKNEVPNNGQLPKAKSQTVTDGELETLSEQLLAADVENNVASLVTLRKIHSHSKKQKHSSRLLVVDPSAYTRETILKLLPLLDNYVAPVETEEEVNALERNEEVAFLDAIMQTNLIKKAEEFLMRKGILPTYGKNQSFAQILQEIWFGLYPRQKDAKGSCGFEHVFIGEIKDGQVEGMHSWIFLSIAEQSMNFTCKSELGPSLSLGSKGRIVKINFEWLNRKKGISSLFVGTSPEFEIALYTVCHFARPNQRCRVKLDGKQVEIQTEDYRSSDGKRYLLTAYPVF